MRLSDKLKILAINVFFLIVTPFLMVVACIVAMVILIFKMTIETTKFEIKLLSDTFSDIQLWRE